MKKTIPSLVLSLILGINFAVAGDQANIQLMEQETLYHANIEGNKSWKVTVVRKHLNQEMNLSTIREFADIEVSTQQKAGFTSSYQIKKSPLRDILHLAMVFSHDEEKVLLSTTCIIGLSDEVIITRADSQDVSEASHKMIAHELIDELSNN